MRFLKSTLDALDGKGLLKVTFMITDPCLRTVYSRGNALSLALNIGPEVETNEQLEADLVRMETHGFIAEMAQKIYPFSKAIDSPLQS